MAVMNKANLEMSNAGLTLKQQLQVKLTFKKLFWTWFDEHRDDQVVKLRIAFLTLITVRVYHVEPLFTLLVGAREAPVTMD